MRKLSLLFLFIVLTTPVFAQSAAVGNITTRGSATVEAQPDYFDFTLVRAWDGDTLAGATRQALTFEKALLEILESRELKALDIAVHGISVPDATATTVKRGARLRFGAGPYRGTGEAMVEFGKLCDTLRGIAEELGCELSGPAPGVNDAQVFEQAAIGQALSESLPLAEGGAGSMNAQIMTVSKAEVVSLTWNADEDAARPMPEIQMMTCTAEVDVTYDFGSNY